MDYIIAAVGVLVGYLYGAYSTHRIWSRRFDRYHERLRQLIQSRGAP